MSKHAFLKMAAILGLAVLSGCTGPKPVFDECGGNNCRNERPDRASPFAAKPAGSQLAQVAIG